MSGTAMSSRSEAVKLSLFVRGCRTSASAFAALARDDAWSAKCLQWVSDVGDLGRHWRALPETTPGEEEREDAASAEEAPAEDAAATEEAAPAEEAPAEEAPAEEAVAAEEAAAEEEKAEG